MERFRALLGDFLSQLKVEFLEVSEDELSIGWMVEEPFLEGEVAHPMVVQAIVHAAARFLREDAPQSQLDNVEFFQGEAIGRGQAICTVSMVKKGATVSHLQGFITQEGKVKAHGLYTVQRKDPLYIPVPIGTEEEVLDRIHQSHNIQYGLDFVSVSQEEAKAIWHPKEEDCNPYGIIHGGVSYTVCDTITGVYATIFGKSVTRNGSAYYFRPMFVEEAEINAKVIYRDNQICRIEGTIVQRGKVCFQALYTMSYLTH
ncbi:MAG: PaaI family thioesterase [Tissierellia bacterium]|nr:PaaI family thioesterase [Tissierellia bacterium]